MSNLIPKEMVPKDIAAVLRDMADRVESGDSYEGSIEYLLPETPDWAQRGEPEPPGWEHRDYRLVRATYRIGNLDGQGSVTMIGEVPEVPYPGEGRAVPGDDG
jgi:hypothetical protein